LSGFVRFDSVRHDRRRVVVEAGHIGAISREETFVYNLRAKADTAGATDVAVVINPAQLGCDIKKFAWDVRVVDPSLEIYFFVAAAPASTAGVLPFRGVLNDELVHAGKLPK